MNQDNDDRVGEVPFFGSRQYSAEERLQINQIKDLEQEFLTCLDRLAKQKGGSSRGLSIAKTHVQTGVLWAIQEVIGV